MTRIIAYHKATHNIALFLTDGQYWIGTYSPFLTHQTGEHPYVWFDGYFDTEAEGLEALNELSGDEH